MEPRLRASPKQFSVLIEFMERHGDLGRPQPGIQGRIKAESLWLELGRQLNSIDGGVHKSFEKWKKVWADWKTKTKGKFLRIRKHACGSSSRNPLTALEERVLAVTGVSRRVGIKEQGFNYAAITTLSCVLPLVTRFQSPLENSSAFVAPLVPSPPFTCKTSPSPLSSLPPLLPQPQTLKRPRMRASNSHRNILRQSLLGVRRNRGSTTFDRAVSEFAAIEQRRLEYEELRDQRLHEREMERLRVESQRVEVSREHNQLLHQLSLLGQHLIDVLTRQSQFANSPSSFLDE
ncbi:hypothetical protein K1T71_013512 [Dendrolimus kikuchii]|uniref:Uncharacterized protein n=1 Tax=Dendrolimus kikuchii TaxID=765133 RepID=A0ACC1CGU7_9NEOP|nr:hypothetical protein K1T71_013512 [Dendrolimus kikuchii]